MRSLYLFAAFAIALPNVAFAQDADLAIKAREVLEVNCYRCHGKDGRFEATFGSVLDVKKLIERRKINPKNPDRSRIYAVMTDDLMPPEGEKPRPSKAEMEIVRKWI